MSEQIHARHILIKHAGSRRPSSFRAEHITRTKDEAIATLEGLRAQLLASPPASFSALAAAHSDCSSAKRGGDLGAFGRGEMQRPFEEAAFALEVREISGIVDTESGVHIIQRLEDPRAEIRAAHVLIKHAGSRNPVSWRRPDEQVTRGKAEARAELLGIREKVVAGEMEFGEAAAKFSDCSSAKANEGDLGFFGEGQMQKPFEEAAYALKVGEVSGVVDSDSGLHIIKRLA